MARGIFSVVATEAYFTAPPTRVTPPPSARQYSASMASKCWLAMNWMPTRVVPSSPASARKITSRSSGDLLALQPQHRHQPGGDVLLVVHRAAAVDVAAVARGAERREGPLLRVHVDRVGVRHDQQRPLAAVAFEARDEVGPVRFEREDLRGDALALEQLLDVVDDAGLVAGRVGGVDAEHRLVVPHHLFFERGRAGACGAERAAVAKSSSADVRRQSASNSRRPCQTPVHRARATSTTAS